MTLDLSLVEPELRDQAAQAFDQGDVVGLLCKMDNLNNLAFVADNIACLKDRGIYEKTLVSAYVATRTNNAAWSLGALDALFGFADRDRLREAGDPFPAGERFVLYRGVAGRGRARKVSGMSWTNSLDQAKWFATRYSPKLPAPAVYETTVSAGDVYCYVNNRQEDDFIFRARRWRKLDIPLSADKG